MKKSLFVSLILTMLLCFSVMPTLAMLPTNSTALAAGPAEPWKGDQGGVVAAQIDAAIRSGKDPSVYVNTQRSTPPKARQQPTGRTVTDVIYVSGKEITTVSGIETETYSRFRAYTLRIYQNNYSLQYTFGGFEAYFARVINAETRNYYISGSNKNVTLSEYFQLIIDYNRMPAHA